MYEFERVKKTNEDLLEDLIQDTNENKLQWYHDDSINYIYCKKWVDKNLPENNKDRICVIFKLMDQEIEEELDDVPYQFQAYFEHSNIISLEVYLSKNSKKEIFCKRIIDHQLKLSELLGLAIHNMKKTPKK